METWLEQEDRLLCEHLLFEREGRAHTHDVWEHCFVHEGAGTIRIGDQSIELHSGQWCSIPPREAHWMIPLATPFSLTLTYSDEPQQFERFVERSPSGALRSVGSKRDGIPHGFWQFFDPNHLHFLSGFLYEGQPVGRWRSVREHSDEPSELTASQAALLLETFPSSQREETP